MSNNANIVIAQSLMMRIKNYSERALNDKNVTIDEAMAEIRHMITEPHSPWRSFGALFVWAQ